MEMKPVLAFLMSFRPWFVTFDHFPACLSSFQRFSGIFETFQGFFGLFLKLFLKLFLPSILQQLEQHEMVCLRDFPLVLYFVSVSVFFVFLSSGISIHNGLPQSPPCKVPSSYYKVLSTKSSVQGPQYKVPLVSFSTTS